MNTLPKSQLIIGYKEVFGGDPPKDRLNFINNCSKEVVLAEICGLNYRLKPKDAIYQDISLETQIKELHYFSGSVDEIFNYFRIRIGKYFQNEKDYGLIFNRASCLFAMEEIIQSDMQIQEGFTMNNSWPQLLKYLLSVNNKITSLSENSAIDKNDISLETLNPKILPLNELSISTNPFFSALRGYKLLSYLHHHKALGEQLDRYMQDQYGFTYDQFIFQLTGLYVANNVNGKNDLYNKVTGESLDMSFYYTLENPDDFFFFDQLSRHYVSQNVERLLSIKKNPFFKNKGKVYLLMDNVFALDKCYNQFINDFWFDCVKLINDDQQKAIYKMQDYRSVIGYFLESYCNEILHYSFENARHYSVRSFKDLKIVHQGGEIEISDLYVRYEKKIFLAEVKSTGLYDDAKFSGEINTFYKNGREEFFKSFGLNQLVKAIENIELLAINIDIKFPVCKSYRIYPAIIVNEKALQTPFMADIFNKRFDELTKHLKKGRVTLSPLSLIHISDLEQMQEQLHANPSIFWDLLDFNIREPKFMPPFYNSLIRKNIKPNYDRVMEMYIELFKKFKPEDM